MTSFETENKYHSIQNTKSIKYKIVRKTIEGFKQQKVFKKKCNDNAHNTVFMHM